MKKTDPAHSSQADIAIAHWMMPGPFYRQVLSWIHEHGRPRNYLEIGVSTGKSFRLAGPETRAVGVDPAIDPGERNNSRTFKMESDYFFLNEDVYAHMNGTIQCAFIDGMHHFDQVIRDFINVEKHCQKDSLILLHDVLPTRPEVGTREKLTKMWTGDVWKAVAILRKIRSDLTLIFVPTMPSGLLFVTNLNPDSTVLAERFDELVETWMPKELPQKTSTYLVGMRALKNEEEPIRAFVCDLWK